MSRGVEWRGVVPSSLLVAARVPEALATQTIERWMALHGRTADKDLRSLWTFAIETVGAQARSLHRLTAVIDLLLQRGWRRLAVEIAVKVDAAVLWVQPQSNSQQQGEPDSLQLAVRLRDDDGVVLDPNLILATPGLRELIQQPFTLPEAYTPQQQYQRLKAAIRALRPELTGFPDGKTEPDQKNRNNWLKFFRDQLDPQADRFQSEPNKPWLVRRTAFDEQLADESILNEFIRTRDTLKKRPPRKNP